LIATIGYSQNEAVPRYFFGTEYLLDGAPLLPIVLGLFALPEMVDLAVRNISIAREGMIRDTGGRELMWLGVRDAIRNWWLVIRSAFIGTYVGIVPGLGGSVTDWIAYGHAVQSTKKDPKFGEGDIRGVIAPETANNAMRGGGLIPTIVFGIPGTTGYAILLGGMLIHGLRPGPSMLTTELALSFSMVWMIIIANLIAATAMMLVSNRVANLAFVPGHLIVPGVMLFVLMGAWLDTSTYGDWITLIVAGIVGYLMKRGGWPRPPIILAFILGAIMENSFLITMNIHQGFGWLTRPIVLIIITIVVVTIIASMRRNQMAVAKTDRSETQHSLDEIPVVSTGLGLLLLAVFLTLGALALDWSYSVKLFPLAACAIGAFLALAALVQNRMRMRAAGISYRLDKGQRDILRGMAVFFLVICAVVLAAPVIGQKLAIPVFILLFCRFWARFSWPFASGYAVAGWGMLVGFYESVLTIFWQPSLLGDIARDILGPSPVLLLFF
ncbi:MAG: tripartite tricarboxylate transporter permease, partial [Boseongicola sp.]|nr:tripartite tricarboxylate transporter permease [Boseongicola sp.]